MMQEIKWINLKKKVMTILNVKPRKKKKYYKFPIYKELEKHIKKLLEHPEVDESDRLFAHFPIGVHNYTDSIWFWYPDIRKLKKAKLISNNYQLKQIRKSAASYWKNELNLDTDTIQYLLAHSDKETTENHYIALNLEKIRQRLDYSNLEGSDEFI